MNDIPGKPLRNPRKSKKADKKEISKILKNESNKRNDYKKWW